MTRSAAAPPSLAESAATTCPAAQASSSRAPEQTLLAATRGSISDSWPTVALRFTLMALHLYSATTSMGACF